MTTVTPSDHEWGSIGFENGTWAGMIGQLVKDEADISCECVMSFNRQQER